MSVRQCMNCGRPQDHRWHGARRPEEPLALANGCSYAVTQPETLMDAVLWPAIEKAAKSAGVPLLHAYRAIWEYGQRA